MNTQTPMPKGEKEKLPPPELSPAAKILAKEASIWNGIHHVMTKVNIPGGEAAIMIECLDAIQKRVDIAELALQTQIKADEDAAVEDAAVANAAPAPADGTVH